MIVSCLIYMDNWIVTSQLEIADHIDLPQKAVMTSSLNSISENYLSSSYVLQKTAYYFKQGIMSKPC